MRDPVSLVRLNQLHPAAIPIFQNFIEAAENDLNITFRITQGLRTFAQQQAFYDQGRTTPGNIVTNAPPGESFHNYGLAVDLAHLVDGGTAIDWHFDMSLLLKYAPQGMNWGGHFVSIKDYPHWELPFGYTWHDLLAKYNAGNFITGTQFVVL